ELVGLDRQTSREIYRTSVSVRLPKFRKGDIVSDKNGNVYRVEKVNGKGMNLKNLATHESEHKDWRTVKRDEIDWVEHEKSEAMLTSLTPKEAQFMDMENYETFEIERPKINLKEGEIYRLVKIKGKYYIEE
ncbi:MAG TPA: Nonsense-mediated mRNA decay NMD3 like protein, partial [Thermococcus paralvinellae]|nr:Nonsense-mediated mRNA decay NMD3 like protein [Thermococcus paralvinellae]